MNTTVRPVETSVVETVSARSCLLRSVRASARQLISRWTSSAIGVTSKSPVPSRPPPSSRRGMPPSCLRAEAEHARDLELAPQMDEPAHAEHGIGEVRGEVARVDRADARSAEDVDLRRRAAHAREIVEHVPEHADLVRAARAAAGEDHRRCDGCLPRDCYALALGHRSSFHVAACGIGVLSNERRHERALGEEARAAYRGSCATSAAA